MKLDYMIELEGGFRDPRQRGAALRLPTDKTRAARGQGEGRHGACEYHDG